MLAKAMPDTCTTLVARSYRMLENSMRFLALCAFWALASGKFLSPSSSSDLQDRVDGESGYSGPSPLASPSPLSLR